MVKEGRFMVVVRRKHLSCRCLNLFVVESDNVEEWMGRRRRKRGRSSRRYPILTYLMAALLSVPLQLP